MAAYFSSKWTATHLWQLELPVVTIPRKALEWHLDYPFWPTAPPEHIFDLRPRDVLLNPGLHPHHHRRILEAETSYPLEVGVLGSTTVILDGIHRLAKLSRESGTDASVRYVPSQYVTKLE